MNVESKKEWAPDFVTAASSGHQSERMRPDPSHHRPPTTKWREQRRNPDQHLQIRTRPEIRTPKHPLGVDYLDVEHTRSGTYVSGKGYFG